MATAKQIKKHLRAHLNQRMDDFRSTSHTEYLKDITYGAVWAASHAEAISDSERDAMINELHRKAPHGSAPLL